MRIRSVHALVQISIQKTGRKPQRSSRMFAARERLAFRRPAANRSHDEHEQAKMI